MSDANMTVNRCTQVSYVKQADYLAELHLFSHFYLDHLLVLILWFI